MSGKLYWGSKSFIAISLDCEKTTVCNITIHPVIDMIDRLFYDIMTGKKVGGGERLQAVPVSSWFYV